MSSAELSAGCYEDLVHWYCSLRTRRTVSTRAAGNIAGTQRKLGQIIPDIVQTQSWHYNTTAVIQRHQKRYIE